MEDVLHSKHTGMMLLKFLLQLRQKVKAKDEIPIINKRKLECIYAVLARVSRAAAIPIRIYSVSVVMAWHIA